MANFVRYFENYIRKYDMVATTADLAELYRAGKGIVEVDPMFMALEPTSLGRKAVIASGKLAGHQVWYCGGNLYTPYPITDALEERIIATLRKYGSGAGGSPLMNGSSPLLKGLEAQLSSFLGYEDTAILPTGARANEALMRVLLEDSKGLPIFVADNSHATVKNPILEKAKQYQVTPVGFSPFNLERLEHKIERYVSKGQAPKYLLMVLVGSTDGAIPGLVREIFTLCEKHNIKIIVDDAHGQFVLGDGRGTERLYEQYAYARTFTFSKGFAAVGGGVSGPLGLIDRVRLTPEYIFTAAHSPLILTTVQYYLETLTQSIEQIERLKTNSMLAYKLLSQGGINLGNTSRITPIFSLMLDESPFVAAEQHVALLRAGVHTNMFAPPASPKNIIRLSLTSAMTEDDIHEIVGTILTWFRSL